MDTRCRAGSLFVLWLGIGAGVPADAQPAPAPAPIVLPTLPPTDAATQAIIRAAVGVVTDILARNRLNAENTAHGTVSYFRHFDLQVRTGTNSYRSVRLHPGTVINPRGATPAAGSRVDISGSGAPDGSLNADTITVIQ